MHPKTINSEHINSIIESQLEAWPLASDNFFNLRKAERRKIRLGSLDAAVQYNPARIRSTGAAVDAASIARRPCFLCKSNRPSEQITVDWFDGWELLVNPYPILPVHFTIASARHEPQGGIPLDMASMAEAAPDLVIFYNGSRAGASAPDHLHVQGVLKTELPLPGLAEEHHDPAEGGLKSSEQMDIDVPFHFISAVVTPDRAGMRTLAHASNAFGIDVETGKRDKGLVNAFFWIDSRGLLRILIVPRKAHRPACYNAPESERMLISPGAIDMTGLVIVPRKEDFDRINEETLRKIYSEVAFADALPDEIRQYFGTHLSHHS